MDSSFEPLFRSGPKKVKNVVHSSEEWPKVLIKQKCGLVLLSTVAWGSRVGRGTYRYTKVYNKWGVKDMICSPALQRLSTLDGGGLCIANQDRKFGSLSREKAAERMFV